MKKAARKKSRRKETTGAAKRAAIPTSVVSPQDLDEIRAHRRSVTGTEHAVDPNCPECNPRCGTCGAVRSLSRFVAVAAAGVEVNEHGQQSGGFVALDGYGYVWHYWPARYDENHKLVSMARWARLTQRRSLGRRDTGVIQDEFFPEADA